MYFIHCYVRFSVAISETSGYPRTFVVRERKGCRQEVAVSLCDVTGMVGHSRVSVGTSRFLLKQTIRTVVKKFPIPVAVHRQKLLYLTKTCTTCLQSFPAILFVTHPYDVQDRRSFCSDFQVRTYEDRPLGMAVV